MNAASVRKSGIYALIDRRAASINPVDATALGIKTCGATRSPLVDAVDPHAPGQIQRLEDADGTTVVLGELEQLADLAARLGMPPDAPPARIARSALAAFGAQLPAELIGEWSLLHHDRGGRLTLVQSAARRDPILYVARGDRIAIAPDIYRLAAIPWIGGELDPIGLLGKVGRPAARAQAGDRTMLARVRQLLPGETVTITPGGGIHRARASLFDTAPEWRGTLADAAFEAEAMLLQILGERTARSPRMAGLLSGGLDSSLLAWAAAEAGGGMARPVFVTSVAPPGSGLADEANEARLVADHLGCEWVPVFPAEDADPYRPPEAVMRGDVGPPISNRHELTVVMQAAAQAAGATSLFNGTFGESTFTVRTGQKPRTGWLRSLAGRTRRWLHAPDSTFATTPFHVRVAPHRLAEVADPFRAPAPYDPLSEPRRDGRLGYLLGGRKGLWLANEFCPGALRTAYPYRDMRLLRLFAGFPRAVLAETGGDREPARLILQDRLPDAIRLRRSGRPASPGHLEQLRRHAPAARGRIAVFRAAGVDDWLDLDWLDTALAEMAARTVADPFVANEVQLTAMTAEFLTWWNSTF